MPLRAVFDAGLPASSDEQEAARRWTDHAECARDATLVTADRRLAEAAPSAELIA